MRKLAMLNRAGRIDDLRIPPNNRLEKLKSSRKSQWSIRVNDQQWGTSTPLGHAAAVE